MEAVGRSEEAIQLIAMADDKRNDPNDQSKPVKNAENARSSTAEKPENAATSYGLEGHEATAWDPRVTELKNQRSQHRRVSMPPERQTATPRRVSASPSIHKSERVQQIINSELASPEKRPEDVERVQKVSVYNAPTSERLTLETNQVPAAPVKPAEELVGKMSPTRLQEEASRVETAHETPQTITVYNPPPPQVQVVAHKSPKERSEGVTKNINTDITFDPSKQYASKTTNTSGLLYETTPSSPPPTPPAPAPLPAVVAPAPMSTPTVVPARKKSKQEMDELYEFAVSLVRKAGAIAVSASKARHGGANKENERNTSAQTFNDIEEKMTRGIKDTYPDHK